MNEVDVIKKSNLSIDTHEKHLLPQRVTQVTRSLVCPIMSLNDIRKLIGNTSVSNKETISDD